MSGASRYAFRTRSPAQQQVAARVIARGRGGRGRGRGAPVLVQAPPPPPPPPLAQQLAPPQLQPLQGGLNPNLANVRNQLVNRQHQFQQRVRGTGQPFVEWRRDVFNVLGFSHDLQQAITPQVFRNRRAGPIITEAVGGWLNDPQNFNRLTTLMRDRSARGIQTVTFRDNPNPATVALAVLHLQATASAESANFRYIIDVRGTLNGQPRQVARTISQQDHQFITRLVSGVTTGQIGGLTLDDEDQTESDQELQFITGGMDVQEVRILRVARGLVVPPIGDDEHEVAIGAQPGVMVPLVPSGEVHPFHSSGRGSSSGSFFGYWLDERWPEDMSMVQVFKKSQQSELGCGKVKLEGAFFELGCLANSFLVQGMEAERLIHVMEIISGTANPNFPTSCLRVLSERLKINIRCVLYDRQHRSKGRRTIDHMGGGLDEDAHWYTLGRIENHFVPDIDSGWGKKAASNFLLYRKELGEKAFEEISLERIKKASAVVQYDSVRPKRLKIINKQKTLTYGELLCILVYGVDPMCRVNGEMRDKEVVGQLPLVTMMEPEDYCLKASLYSRFKKQFASRDLPTYKTENEMEEWIRSSSKEMTKKKQILLSDHFGMRAYPLTAELGAQYIFRDTHGKRIHGRRGYAVIDDHYHRMGHTVGYEWCFRDKYVLPSGSTSDRTGQILFDVPQWYTVLTMDSETYCSKEIDPKTGLEILRHRPYMFCVAYFQDDDGRVKNFREMNGELYRRECANFNAFSRLSFYDRIIHGGFKTVNNVGVGGAHLVIETFRGITCAQDVCDFFASDRFRDYHLHVVSHNAHYDINMLVGFSDAIITAGIIKSANRLNTVTMESGGKVSNHQCSYAVTGIPLRDFAETFDLDVGKEYMPYDIYTKENLFMDNGNQISPFLDATQLLEDVWEIAGAPSLEVFKESYAKSCYTGKILQVVIDNDRFEDSPYFHLWRYAEYYCKMDCEVLMKGFLNLRYELFHLPIPDDTRSENEWSPCRLDIIHAASLPQYASHYMGRCGVFDGVYQFKGSIREFISRGVVGGKCMMMGNAPHHVVGTHVSGDHDCDVEIDDFDACSLYPTAMQRIADEGKGFTTGLPKFVNLINDETGTGPLGLPKELEDVHQFFASVRVHGLGRPLLIPIISVTDNEDNEGGGRHFTNHPNGASMVIDRITYEDICEHHEGASIEFKQALYWTKPCGNTRIGPVIQYLYSSRMELKKQGKGAAQQARKLTMNSAYGRMIMKPIEKKLFFIEGEEKIFHYIARHSTSLATANFIRSDFAVVDRHMPVFEHFSTPHLGGHVLSMAKRIMNEVTTLAHDNDILIHYMDTDSMHIAKKNIPLLSTAFLKKYNRKLVVTPGVETCLSSATEAMGRFHSDFKGLGKAYTSPVSTEFIVVGKKAYYDRLMVHETTIPEGERTTENATYYDHIRMKGVPTECIKKYAMDHGTTVRKLFLCLLEGEPLEFDLVNGSTRFEMTKAFETNTRVSFTRGVQLDFKKIERAKEDWKLNGWPAEMFPYVYLSGESPLALPPLVSSPTATSEVMHAAINLLLLDAELDSTIDTERFIPHNGICISPSVSPILSPASPDSICQLAYDNDRMDGPSDLDNMFCEMSPGLDLGFLDDNANK